MILQFNFSLSELNTLSRLVGTELARLTIKRSGLEKDSEDYLNLSSQIHELENINISLNL